MNNKKAKKIRKMLKQKFEALPNTAQFKDQFGNVTSKQQYIRRFYQQFKANV